MKEERKAEAGRKSGRPPAFDHEDAIDAAMQLFWRRGYGSVSTSDLADAMAIQRSSFYNSFGDRDRVFREALARYAPQAPDAPLARIAADEPVVPTLVAVFRDICRMRAADVEVRGCLVVNSVAELVGVDDALGPMITQMMQRQIDLLERLIRQAVRRGELPPLKDPAADARAFVAFQVGLNLIAKVVRNEKQLWAMCRAFLENAGIPEAAFAVASARHRRATAGARVRRDPTKTKGTPSP